MNTYTFCYNSYVIFDNENKRVFFEVVNKDKKHGLDRIIIDVSETISGKFRFLENVEAYVFKDEKRNEEFVVIYGKKIYASEYYNPSVETLVVL